MAPAYKVKLTKRADKAIDRILLDDKSNAKRIVTFIKELKTAENPFAINNAKKLSGYKDRWRWRVGLHYRVVGIRKDNILTIEIIEIASRENIDY